MFQAPPEVFVTTVWLAPPATVGGVVDVHFVEGVAACTILVAKEVG